MVSWPGEVLPGFFHVQLASNPLHVGCGPTAPPSWDGWHPINGDVYHHFQLVLRSSMDLRNHPQFLVLWCFMFYVLYNPLLPLSYETYLVEQHVKFYIHIYIYIHTHTYKCIYMVVTWNNSQQYTCHSWLQYKISANLMKIGNEINGWFPWRFPWWESPISQW